MDDFSEFPPSLTTRQRADLVGEYRRFKRLSTKLKDIQASTQRKLAATAAELERVAAERDRLKHLLDDALTKAEDRPAATQAPVMTESVVPHADAHQPSDSSPARRPNVMIRRSAAFSMMQGLLTAAKRQRDTNDEEEVRKRRVEIEHRAKLQTTSADSNRVAAELAALEQIEADAQSAADAARQEAEKLALVVERMTRCELEYSTAFFLKASGNDYDVFFVPAVHSEETRLMLRTQIEEAFNAYQPFRKAADEAFLAIAARREAGVEGHVATRFLDAIERKEPHNRKSQ